MSCNTADPRAARARIATRQARLTPVERALLTLSLAAIMALTFGLVG